MIHLITYDLHEPDRDYKDVIEQIKVFGACAHAEESVWLVDTLMTPVECRDALNAVTTEASYFVARLRPNWAPMGLVDPVITWLKDSRRRW